MWRPAVIACALCGLVACLVGCGSAADSHAAPPASTIETLDVAAPPLVPTSTNWRPDELRVAAKLNVDDSSKSLYVAEWAPPNAETVQYVVFVGDDNTPTSGQPWTALSDFRSRPLGLWEWAEYGGGWVDATVGTVDSSVDSVRLIFEQPGCGSATYPADGPSLRSVPERKVFMLDQSNGCLWKTAEALKDGKVVQTLEKPVAPHN